MSDPTGIWWMRTRSGGGGQLPMTANDHPSANLNQTAADGTVDASRTSGFDGFVPITLWRLDERTHDGPAGERGAGFEARVARRIVEIFSRVGEVVIDFDADQN